MIRQFSAHLFLKETNRIIADERSRTVSVLDNRTPVVGSLRSVDEETLAPGISKEIKAAGGVFLLVPVVGDLNLLMNAVPQEVKCGQMALFNGTAVGSIRNGYENELVQFLLLQFNIPGLPDRRLFHLYSFDLDKKAGTGSRVFTWEEVAVSIRKMRMREELVYKPRPGAATVFCYMIRGSGEIAGRLLHDGDGLVLWNSGVFETESFGPETILLLIEMVQ